MSKYSLQAKAITLAGGLALNFLQYSPASTKLIQLMQLEVMPLVSLEVI
jgi:hypothetical protein